jgi:hypothetical protein
MTPTVTLNLLCGDCNKNTSIVRDIQLGDNSTSITCASCGERWQVLFEITSLDPPHIGTMLTKRVLGIVKGGQFFSKEQLS